MDLIVGLPPLGGKSAIMVVVGRLSKYAHFIALPTQFTAFKVASVFVTEICCLHGIPKTIISDRDRVFMSHLWQELFHLSGTKLRFNMAHNPQTDGQTNVTNL